MLTAESFIERNPWSPGVAAAVVLFLLGTGITLYLRFRDKQSKTLDYRIVSDIPIVTSHNRPELLTITIGKRNVQNPIITEVRFMNTGKKVIESEDYLNELIVVRESATVLDFNITDQSEPNLVERISHAYNGTANVIVEPRTLNAGDWFTAQILYDGDITQKVACTTRIKEQTRRMRAYVIPSAMPKREFIFITGAMFVLVPTAIWMIVRFDTLTAEPTNNTATFVMLVSSLVASTGAYLRALWRYRRKASMERT